MAGNSPTPAAAQKRYRANVALSYEPKSKPKSEHRRWKAGAECKNAPDNWPPKWVLDQGLATEIVEDDPSTHPSVQGDEN